MADAPDVPARSKAHESSSEGTVKGKKRRREADTRNKAQTGDDAHAGDKGRAAKRQAQEKECASAEDHATLSAIALEHDIRQSSNQQISIEASVLRQLNNAVVWLRAQNLRWQRLYEDEVSNNNQLQCTSQLDPPSQNSLHFGASPVQMDDRKCDKEDGDAEINYGSQTLSQSSQGSVDAGIRDLLLRTNSVSSVDNGNMNMGMIRSNSMASVASVASVDSITGNTNALPFSYSYSQGDSMKIPTERLYDMINAPSSANEGSPEGEYSFDFSFMAKQQRKQAERLEEKNRFLQRQVAALRRSAKLSSSAANVGNAIVVSASANTVVRVGVGVLVCYPQAYPGCVLVGERMGSHGAGTWSPPGGHLEHGEAIELCASRELEEETGIKVELKDLKILGVTNDVMKEKLLNNSDTLHYVTVWTTIVLHHQEGTQNPIRAINAEPDKCREWRWMRWESLISDAKETGNSSAGSTYASGKASARSSLFSPLINFIKNFPAWRP